MKRRAAVAAVTLGLRRAHIDTLNRVSISIFQQLISGFFDVIVINTNTICRFIGG
jgi:hypothetical protein